MIVTTRRRGVLGMTTALWLSLAAVSAVAQDAAQAPTPDEDSRETADVLILDPITLYAYRQEAGVRDVAASISVIDGQQIGARGLSDMKELVRYTPGVTAPRQTSGANPASSLTGFNIRGVGGNRVQMVVDGSRLPELITDGTRDYLDLNFTRQVEIVKGPASVLWGRMRWAGSLRLRRSTPRICCRAATSAARRGCRTTR